jgi:hypothetical protein
MLSKTKSKAFQPMLTSPITRFRFSKMKQTNRIQVMLKILEITRNQIMKIWNSNIVIKAAKLAKMKKGWERSPARKIRKTSSISGRLTSLKIGSFNMPISHI